MYLSSEHIINTIGIIDVSIYINIERASVAQNAFMAHSANNMRLIQKSLGLYISFCIFQTEHTKHMLEIAIENALANSSSFWIKNTLQIVKQTKCISVISLSFNGTITRINEVIAVRIKLIIAIYHHV